jgi:hypothetical protein
MAKTVKGRGGTKKAASKKTSSKKAAAKKSQTKGVRDDRSDYKNKQHVEKLEEANKKDGCLPKLFMLALPFLAIGAFFVARL